MDYGKPLPPIPADHNDLYFNYDTYRHELNTLLPSSSCIANADQYVRRTSETSCPSLLGDSFSSISDIEHIGYSSSDDGWDAYWSPSKTSSRTPSMHLDVAIRPALKTQLSHENRNFGISDLYGLHPQSKRSSMAGDLHKFHAPRPRKKRSHTFSPMSTSRASALSSSDRPNRARANTDPRIIGLASDNGICTTITCDSKASSSQGSPLYMMSYPFPSPIIAPLNLADETSYFSDDEDDRRKPVKLAKFLSRSSGGDEKERPKTGSDRIRRSFGEVRDGMRSVFRIKK